MVVYMGSAVVEELYRGCHFAFRLVDVDKVDANLGEEGSQLVGIDPLASVRDAHCNALTVWRWGC